MRILLLVICFAIPSSALAETFTITSGTFAFPTLGGVGDLDLYGSNGFEYHAALFTDMFRPSVMTCVHTRSTCLPGDVVGAHLNKAGGDLRGVFSLEGGTYTVEPGIFVTYPNSVFLSLSGTAILPNDATQSALTFTFPFTYTVTVVRLNLPTYIATGEGNVTVDYASLTYPLTQGEDPIYASGWTVNSAIYNITPPDPAVVPEPATIILVGTGLAAWHQRRRRERRAQVI